MLKKIAICNLTLALLTIMFAAAPVKGSAPGADDAVYAYNRDNLYYADTFEARR